MSTSLKVIIGLVVVAGVIWGVMMYTSHTQTAAYAAPTTPVTNTPGQPATQVNNDPKPSPSSDTSDAGMTQDMTAVNAQMNTVSTNSAASDQSFNDQPVTQGQ